MEIINRKNVEEFILSILKSIDDTRHSWCSGINECDFYENAENGEKYQSLIREGVESLREQGRITYIKDGNCIESIRFNVEPDEKEKNLIINNIVDSIVPDDDGCYSTEQDYLVPDSQIPTLLKLANLKNPDENFKKCKIETNSYDVHYYFY